MAAAHEDPVRNANLMRPAPVISSGQPDWSRPEWVRALEVIPWLVKQDGHGQTEIAAVLRNRQFVARQKRSRQFSRIGAGKPSQQPAGIERGGHTVIGPVGLQGLGKQEAARGVRISKWRNIEEHRIGRAQYDLIARWRQ